MIYDISPLITSELAVFPGDTKFQRFEALSFKAGHHLDLSSIQTTLHIGAHADSSSHYHCDGQGIEARSVEVYLGLCQVISTKKRADLPERRLQIADLKTSDIKAPRVLINTQSFPDPNHWTDDFDSCSPELLQFLADQKVKLVGIDTPSVDPSTAKSLLSHQVLFRNDMAVLEGVVLTEVPDGLYDLIALPLKIKDADASPVRAILLQIHDGQTRFS